MNDTDTDMPPISTDEALGLLRTAQSQPPQVAFPKLVCAMRTAQTKYFRSRTPADLIESKRLERLVDTALRNMELEL